MNDKKRTKTKNPPRLLLAHQWDERDPSGWWMSEKLDGVRAYWDGEKFISRGGNVYHAPSWFTADLPPVALDGELWIDRKAFEETVSIVRGHDSGDRWRKVCYVVFDAPSASGDFEERTEYLRGIFAAGKRFARRLGQYVCRGFDHLAAELARVESLGGEGVMLRAPGSVYEPRRSETLLKVKTFRDAEAVVVGHKSGKGRNAERLGALIVKMPCGNRFSVGGGLSDADRQTPPPIGSVITYKYQELTKGGVPRFASFLRRHTA